MCGAIGTHQTGTVQRKHDRQVLQGHVVDELVVGALQEGRIDCHHGLQALAGQARGKGHGVLFGNAHVEVTIGEAALELDHARALAHGRRDAHQTWVGLCHIAQPVAEHLREGGFGRGAGLDQADRGVKLARAVVGHGVGLSELVALAFFRDHVQELWARALVEQLDDVFQRGDEGFEVVPVDRADVIETEFLEQGGGHHHAFGVLFKALGQLKQWRRVFEHLFAHAFGRGVEAPAHELRQVAVERAHGRGDRHVVVVEHDQQTPLRHTRVVQGFKGHASGHGAVANDGHRRALLALDVRSQCHAQGRGNAGGGVGGAEGVELALDTARKAADAAVLAQTTHAVAATGEDFVRVGLVAHVPHQSVVRRVEHTVQRDGEFHRAQVGAQMAAGLGHAVQDVFTQLIGDLLELVARQAAQVGGGFDRSEQLGHGCSRLGSLVWCGFSANAGPPNRPVGADAQPHASRCAPRLGGPRRAMHRRVLGLVRAP